LEDRISEIEAQKSMLDQMDVKLAELTGYLIASRQVAPDAVPDHALDIEVV
jgi:hypothetical protein